MADFSTSANPYWMDFPQTYRAEEVQCIARWLAAGESGIVVGVSGAGKSNLIGFVASQPAVVSSHLPASQTPILLLHFDVNSLPLLSTHSLFRGLLFTLQQAVQAGHPGLKSEIDHLLEQSKGREDDFTLFMTLQAAHRSIIRQSGVTIVWLLDRFDEACSKLEAQSLNSLRNLRDQFRGKLCFVIATRQPLERLRDLRQIDEFYEIVAGNVCWVGPMGERDCRWIAGQMAERLHTTFSEAAIVRMIEVSGGLPAFLRAICLALAQGDLTMNSSLSEWVETSLSRPEIMRVCRDLWHDLPSPEQLVLKAIATGNQVHPSAQQNIRTLLQSGLLKQQGKPTAEIFSPLFARYLLNQHGKATPGIALHPQSRAPMRDGISLGIDLTNHEDRLLAYFLAHVNQVCSKDELMAAIWPDDLLVEGLNDERLAQLIKRLRDKIEPEPNNPLYIQTVRGRGYKFVQPVEGEGMTR